MDKGAGYSNGQLGGGATPPPASCPLPGLLPAPVNIDLAALRVPPAAVNNCCCKSVLAQILGSDRGG